MTDRTAGAAFVAAERWVSEPMLPPGLFRRPGFATANAVAAAMNLGTLFLLFLLTLYLQTVQHRSALAAGVAVLPLFLPLSLLAPLAGRTTARRGPRLAMTAGLLLAAAGTGLLATWSAAPRTPRCFPACSPGGSASPCPARVSVAAAALVLLTSEKRPVWEHSGTGRR